MDPVPKKRVQSQMTKDQGQETGNQSHETENRGHPAEGQGHLLDQSLKRREGKGHQHHQVLIL